MTPIRICTLGKVKYPEPVSARRRTKRTTRPTLIPIANPPHRKAVSCSSGRGRFSSSTVMPIRKGSKLTATAITKTVINMIFVAAPGLSRPTG